MTCQDPSKCGTGITQGEPLKLTYVYSTGVASTTSMWQTYKSDASQAGIDINLIGQSFDTIIGESAPCAPMGPKCNIQVFAYGGWNFDGPGLRADRRAAVRRPAPARTRVTTRTRRWTSLINATHTSSSLAVFHQYATFGAQQLPFIWAPTTRTGCRRSTTS